MEPDSSAAVEVAVVAAVVVAAVAAAAVAVGWHLGNQYS